MWQKEIMGAYTCLCEHERRKGCMSHTLPYLPLERGGQWGLSSVPAVRYTKARCYLGVSTKPAGVPGVHWLHTHQSPRSSAPKHARGRQNGLGTSMQLIGTRANIHRNVAAEGCGTHRSLYCCVYTLVQHTAIPSHRRHRSVSRVSLLLRFPRCHSLCILL